MKTHIPNQYDSPFMRTVREREIELRNARRGAALTSFIYGICAGMTIAFLLYQICR